MNYFMIFCTHKIYVLYGCLLSTADCVFVDTINTELVASNVIHSVVVIVLVIILLLLDTYIVITGILTVREMHKKIVIMISYSNLKILMNY